MTTSDKIRAKYPLKVERIIFDDGSMIENKTVMICGEFLIVENETGGSPTMYNVRHVNSLERVQEIRPSQHIAYI